MKLMYLTFCAVTSSLVMLIQNNEPAQELNRIIQSNVMISKEYPNPMFVWQFYPFPKHSEHAWVTESLPVSGSKTYPNVIRIEDEASVKLGHKIHIMEIIDVIQKPDGTTFTSVRETFGRKIKN